MAKISKALDSALASAKKVAILSVGARLRGDDAAGILVGERLSRARTKLKKSGKKYRVFMGETAPENLTGVIKAYGPTHLIVIDAVDAGEKPGHICFFEGADSLGRQSGISTHNLPLGILINYLEEATGCKTVVIGIQPKTREFGDGVTAPVQKAVEQVAEALRAALV